MLLACGPLQQLVPVVQVTLGLATSSGPLSFPKAACLEFARTSDKPGVMQREMLTPYMDCARALLMCSLHDLDPYHEQPRPQPPIGRTHGYVSFREPCSAASVMVRRSITR